MFIFTYKCLKKRDKLTAFSLYAEQIFYFNFKDKKNFKKKNLDKIWNGFRILIIETEFHALMLTWVSNENVRSFGALI